MKSERRAKWVPDFPSADKITIAYLLNHHSGIQDSDKLRGIFRRNFTTADAVDAIKAEPLDSVPGEKYSYTTWNYAILAYIIERVTGDSYANVVKKYVYDPAGMRDSGELSTTLVVPRLANGYMPAWEAMLPEGDDHWFLPLDFGHLALRLDDSGQLVEGMMTTTWSRTPMKIIAR